MRKVTVLLVGVIVGLAIHSLPADDKAPATTDRDQALAKLEPFIGGVWGNDNPKFIIEFRYEWVFNKSAIRGLGVIDKGGPHETKVEATMGWDPAKKSIYYVDFHGSSQVFYGTMQPKDGGFQIDFETIVGPAAKFRSVGKFPEPNTYEFTIASNKDGQYTPMHNIKLMRKKA